MGGFKSRSNIICTSPVESVFTKYYPYEIFTAPKRSPVIIVHSTQVQCQGKVGGVAVQSDWTGRNLLKRMV